MQNLLRDEKSPYLLQHADNPVDWRPWSESAFREAEEKEIPVFLSIGYATCHWCHVMAHESFEDPQVASLMNENFINIKVDREERPDIDSTYMTVCQMITGHGGWPLTIIMTPGKRPFFAGTYIPKESYSNRQGMLDLIPRISNVWKNERERVLRVTEKISSEFTRTLQHDKGDFPEQDLLKKAYLNLRERYDTLEGGFSRSPKFPTPHNLTFLLHYAHCFGSEDAHEMATHTLEKMRLGGIFDQIGFGFHRYSTDRRWLLPHFEKMLYDQALLMRAYTDAWIFTGNELFKRCVYEIAAYVREQLTGKDGGFYSAEDADSEGEEGKFYVWKLQEIRDSLPTGDAALATEVFELDPDGNFRDEATGKKTGANILHMRARAEVFAEERNLPIEKFDKRMEQILQKLKSDRDRRVRPLLDDKILTDWNGLMIASLAHASSTFDDPALLEPSEKACEFVLDSLSDSEGNLLHRYRDGSADIPGMADDWAFFIQGLIRLYQATFNTDYLKKALTLNERFLDRFFDKERGGIYLTDESADELLGRQKAFYDGAVPSSNSVSIQNLTDLSRLTGNIELEKRAGDILRALSGALSSSPDSATFALQGFLRTVCPSFEIVICGKPDDRIVTEMIGSVRRTLKSPHVLILKTEENSQKLAELAPFTENYPVGDKTAAYVCRNFSCDTPVYSTEDLVDKIIDRDFM